MPRLPFRSTRVDAARLRADRLNRGWTQENLAEYSNPKFSLATYRRAERGGPISLQSLESISKAFGHDIERYVFDYKQSVEHSIVFDISGHWKSLYVEEDINKPPYLTIELLTIEQNDENINGIYECKTYERPNDFYMIGKIIKNMVYGKYYVPGRDNIDGFGVFQLMISRNNEWFEGFCSWVDYDKKIVETSKNIWVKSNSHFFDVLFEDAFKRIEREIEVFHIRKNMQL